MLGALRSDATNSLSNLPPAGSVVAGGPRRKMAEALRRLPEEIGEAKGDK